MRKVFIDRLIVILLFFLLAVVLFVTSSRPIRTFDPWWHLATGKWIFEHATIPRADFFSFTMAGKPWIDLAWLFQIIEYAVYFLVGFYGLVALKILLVFLTFYFLWKLLRMYRIPTFFVLGLMLMVASISYTRFMVRPHLFSFLYVVVFLYLMILYVKKGQNISLVFLAFVYLLWVNTHGSFVVAPFWAVAFLVGALFKRLDWQILDVLNDAEVKRISLVIALLAVLSFVNPYGVKYVTFALFSHRGMGESATRYIAEWQPMSVYNLFVLSPFSRIGQIALLFWITFILLILNLCKKRWYVVTQGILFAFVLYLSLKYVRFAALASFVLAFCVGCLLHLSIDDFGLWTKRILIFVVVVFPLVFIVFRLLPSRMKDADWGRAVSRNYPHGVVRFIRSENLEGRIFNKYGYGGFLIWKLFPKDKVFIDGRTPTVYPAEFYWVYRMAYGNKDFFGKLEKRYKFDMVIEDPNSKIAHYLDKMESWKLCFYDGVSVLFLNRKLMMRSNIECLEHYKPWLNISEVIKKEKEDKEKLKEIRKELERILSVYSNNLKATTDLGILLSEGFDSNSEALLVLKRAVEINPSSPNAWYNLGLVYKKLKDYSNANLCLKRALSLDSDFSLALYQLGMIAFKESEFDTAYEYFKKYIDIVSDRTPEEVYERMGLACFKLLRFKQAIINFTKARFLSNSPDVEAKLELNIGNCYFAMRKWDSAIKHYLEAIKLDDSLKEAYYNISKAYKKVGDLGRAKAYMAEYIKLGGNKNQ